MEPAAVLIAAFEIHVGRPGKAEALVEDGEVARTGIEPDVENVVLLAEGAAAALGAGVARGQEFGGRALIPDVGAVLAEEGDDAVENGAIGDRLAAGVAIENDDGHAPYALARDAPIGAGGDHVGDALLTPGGHPADLLDGFERALAEIVALHADEPLLGGAEDGRVVAAPAVRIGVSDLLEAAEGVVRFQNFDDDGVGLPKRFCR